MGSAILFTAEHMQQIEDATVVSMAVNGIGHLIVTRHDGSTFDAGDVTDWLPGRLTSANNLGTGNDPDVFTETGWYAGTDWISTLAGFSFGILEVLAYDDDYIVQNFYTAEPTPRRFNRARFGGTWTIWAEKDAVASTTKRGEVVLATDAEALSATETTKAITPANLAAKKASSAEVIDGVIDNKFVTPDGLAAVTATNTRRGIVELATDAETLAGTDTSRAITPANLLARFIAERPVKTVIIAQSTIIIDALDNADYYKITWNFPVASVANVLTGRIRTAGAPISAGYDDSFFYGYNNTTGEVSDVNSPSIRIDNGNRNDHVGQVELYSLNALERTVYFISAFTISSTNVPAATFTKGSCRNVTSCSGFQLDVSSGTVTGYITVERKQFA